MRVREIEICLKAEPKISGWSCTAGSQGSLFSKLRRWIEEQASSGREDGICGD